LEGGSSKKVVRGRRHAKKFGKLKGVKRFSNGAPNPTSPPSLIKMNGPYHRNVPMFTLAMLRATGPLQNQSVSKRNTSVLSN